MTKLSCRIFASKAGAYPRRAPPLVVGLTYKCQASTGTTQEGVHFPKNLPHQQTSNPYKNVSQFSRLVNDEVRKFYNIDIPWRLRHRRHSPALLKLVSGKKILKTQFIFAAHSRTCPDSLFTTPINRNNLIYRLVYIGKVCMQKC